MVTSLEYFVARGIPRKGETFARCHTSYESNSKERLNMSEEIWKPIQGYEGYYEISSHGNVKSLDRTIKSKTGWTRFCPKRKMTAREAGKGYLIVGLSKNGITSSVSIHRATLSVFRGSCPEGCEGSHIDGDKTNNRIDNLLWETHKENMLRVDQSKVNRLVLRGSN